MMKKINKYIFASLALALSLQSCNDFLDTLSDNRTSIEDTEGVAKLLASAYPNKSYVYPAELMSDNSVELIDNRTYNTLESSELYNWEAPKQDDYNDAPKSFWQNSYRGVTVANHALALLESMPNGGQKDALEAEAKLLRAYSIFNLSNIYSHSYNPKYAATDLGVPYITEIINQIRVEGNRSTVKENYEMMEKDINEALPKIDDNVYKQPKYRFNRKAAYAFAARFYLYYQKWDKVVESANQVLGSNPKSILRDWDAFRAYSRITSERPQSYASPDNKANLLVLSGNTNLSRLFGLTRARFVHAPFVSEHMTTEAVGAWGNTANNIKMDPVTLSAPFNVTFVQKYPDQFEILDYTQGIGFLHTTLAAFTTDEALLNRAEALIHLQKYDEALADMNLWLENVMLRPTTLTYEQIEAWNKATKYARPSLLTPRNAFNADFEIVDRKQNNYLQVLLHMRRIETIHQGLRWMDVKRYGIVLQRFAVNENNETIETGNILKVRDPRRAMQLPEDVIVAGLQANDRPVKKDDK